MAAALLVTLALACAPSPSPSREAAPDAVPAAQPRSSAPGSQTRKGLYQDLAYADGERLLDLYLPQRGGPAPVAVWLHGGSWVTGDKRPVPAVLLGLCDRGFAVAAVNYRLTGVSSHPAQLHDVKGAVRWLRAHADEYGLDPARVYLVGFSAGGHLASLAGLTGGDAALEGDVGGNLD
ncbi:MAG: alpha/beta hydrolase, partial [Dehalococcoidia bacterium]